MTRAAWIAALALVACSSSQAVEPVGPVTSVVSFRSVQAWCAHNGIVVGGRGMFDPPERVLALAPSDEALYAVGGEPGVRGTVWRLDPEGRLVQRRDLGTDTLEAVAYDPRHHRLVVGGADGAVLELRPDDLSTLAELWRHTAPCRGLAFSAGGLHLLSGGRDGLLRLRDTDTGNPDPDRVIRDHTGGVECCAFADNGLSFGSGAVDGRLRIHDLDGRLLRSSPALGNPVLAVASRGDDGFVFGTADGRVLMLAADPAKPMRTLAQFDQPVRAVDRFGSRSVMVGLDGRVERVDDPESPILTDVRPIR